MQPTKGMWRYMKPDTFVYRTSVATYVASTKTITGPLFHFWHHKKTNASPLG